MAIAEAIYVSRARVRYQARQASRSFDAIRAVATGYLVAMTPESEPSGSQACRDANLDIGRRFAAVLSHNLDPLRGAETLPTDLTKACVEVLQVDGAGLSAVSDRVQVPLGASDDDAVAAERLQFTVGEVHACRLCATARDPGQR